jgi:uncharacterized membrane protein
LIWNLFLAWLPIGGALLAYNLQNRHSRMNLFVCFLCFLGWFFFFPNAPYLLTDLIHLHVRPDAPFWFDLVLLLSFAWTGFFLGVVSLLLMQEIVRKAAGTFLSWLFALMMLGVGSFGIYLGRFMRWNSWDVFSHPVTMLLEVARQFRHPFMHAQTMVFSLIFGCFLVAMYLTLAAVTGLRHDVAPDLSEGK